MSLVFQINKDDGQIIQIVPQKFVPLNFDSLKLAVADHTQFEFNILSDEIFVINGGVQTKIPENSFTGTINLHHPIPFYALTQSGWLPMPFFHPRNFLVDYNIIVFIEKIIAGKVLSGSVQAEWWLEMVKGKEVIFNPLPFAMEGNKKAFPTLQEFKDLYNDASQTINKHLPDVRVIPYDDATFTQVYDVLTQIVQRYDPVNDFLLATIPLILHHAKDSNKPKIQDEIFEAAEHFGVKFISFPFLAVISCLYEKPTGDYFPASRRILKPSANYSSDVAYNAMADLRNLEIYAALCGLSRSGLSDSFAFCTSDKALAVFGLGLNPRNVIIDEKGATFTVSIDEKLFPTLEPAGQTKLAERILKG